MTDTVNVSRELLRQAIAAMLGVVNGEPITGMPIVKSVIDLRAALDATCQDSRHVPDCADTDIQAAPMQAQFTDDELDLFRQWYNSIQDTNGGYLVELDHALFRKLRAIKEAPVQEPVCRGCGIPINDIHMSTCPTKKWPMYVTPADAAQPAPVQEPEKLNPLTQLQVAYVMGLRDAQPRKAVKLIDAVIREAADKADEGQETAEYTLGFAREVEAAVLKANGWTE